MELDCDRCWYNSYDEEEEEYYCRKNIDEDDWARMINGPKRRCPYFIDGNDHLLSRKQ